MTLELQQAPDVEVHQYLIRALCGASHLPNALLYRLHVVIFPVSLEAIPALSCHHVLELRSQTRDALLATIKLQCRSKDILTQAVFRTSDYLCSYIAATRPGQCKCLQQQAVNQQG